MTGEREDGLPEDWEVLSRADARALAPPPGAKERVRLQVALTLGLGATLGAGAASTAAAGAASVGAAGAAGAGQVPAAEGALAAAAKALLVKKVVVATVAAATAVTGGTAAFVEVRARQAQETARRVAAQRMVAVPSQPAVPALPVVEPSEEPAPVEASLPSVLDTLGDERTLLDQARAAIAHGRFGEAEVLLARHAQAFPAGRLVEEREALGIRLLVREGHLSEAHRRAVHFRQQHPHSIQLPVIDEALRGRR
ncbi:MAG TPA: hypothetical protein VK454_12105 [Myxococcaceae bacterium]|nr:hypothetical protein [Myxococcaceae bacterium]